MNLTLAEAAGRTPESYVDPKPVRMVCFTCVEEMHNTRYTRDDDSSNMTSFWQNKSRRCRGSKMNNSKVRHVMKVCNVLLISMLPPRGWNPLSSSRTSCTNWNRRA